MQSNGNAIHFKSHADIAATIYKNGEVSIPRYILIDKNGMVINWNAPRPSDSGILPILAKM